MEFRLSKVRTQAAMRQTPYHEWAFPDGERWTQFFRTDAGYLLRFAELADFEISIDLTVTCYPALDVTQDACEHLYLNHVRPLLLSKQGKLVFHASAVEIAGVAAAFLAESGRGKSTLAASFATGGYRFLTDDGLVVEPGSRGFSALPSHPSIRLCEDSRRALAVATAAAPDQHTDKARLLAGEGIAFCAQPRRLQRAYFLGDGQAASVTFEPMSAPEAMMEWVKSSFLLDPKEPSLLAAHFGKVAELANRLPCYRLDYPRRFTELPRVRQAITEHLQEAGVAA